MHSDLEKISGLFGCGCEDMRVIEKTFLIKSINLMGSRGRFARSRHCNCGLTHCWGPAGLGSGA